MQDGKHVILCVDDDEDIRLVLKAVLEANGYAAVMARTGEEGLNMYKESSPDLIIVDLMMEEIDAGTNFVKELKAQGVTVPVFMLSSVGDTLHMTTDYASLGLAGVLQKPLENEQLLSILKSKLA